MTVFNPIEAARLAEEMAEDAAAVQGDNYNAWMDASSRLRNNARSASEQLRAACAEVERLKKEWGELRDGSGYLLRDRDRLAARVHELTLLAADACDIASGQFYSGGRLRDDARTLELFERIAAIRAALKGGSK